MIPITVNRSPFTGDGPHSRQKYSGALLAERYGSGGWIAITFCTNPKGLRKQSFYSAIGPRDFKDLARLMMEVDPVEAIKAFGVAMQEVSEASTCIRQDAQAA
jgi:hypothetical protein